MLPSDAQTCFDYVADLWPRWDAERSEESVWLTGIEKLNTTPDRFRQAVDAAYLENKYLSPRFKSIRDALATIPGGGDRDDQEQPFEYTGWWAVRRDKPDQRPLMLKSDHGKPDAVLHRIVADWINGTEDAIGLAEMYGGEWYVVGPGARDAIQARRGIGDAEYEHRYQAAREQAQAAADRETT